MSKFLNISTDNTLGGNSASDDIVASQKAVKDYIDNKPGLTVDQTYNAISTNAQSGTAVAEAIAGAGKRNIGEIIESVVPLTDAGLHLLDGDLISGIGSYAEFVDYIAGLVSGYPDLFITEANWQTSVTTYGVCGKFVYDSVNNTVRLPKITGFTEGTTDLTALGDLLQAGLPAITHTHTRGTMEITGTLGHTRSIGGNVSGCFTKGSSSSTPAGAGNTANTPYLYGFKGSSGWTGSTSNNTSVNAIYGRSSTVQPQAIKILYYIVISNSTKTDIEVDIDEVMTDLALKADNDAVVHLVGNETINGSKTFTSSVLRSASLGSLSNSLISLNDSNNKGSMGIQAYYTGSRIYFRLLASNTTSGKSCYYDLQVNDDGTCAFVFSGSSTISNFYTNNDNVTPLGSSSHRWKQLYAGTTTINTSDERLKQQISIIPDEVLDAWGEVGFCQYKFNDAVEEKGDNARFHTGIIAQRIERIFNEHNLNAFDYGLLCYDEWEAQEEILDDNGEILQAGCEAGNRYSLRYEECLCVEAAYQRRRADRIEQRLEVLEKTLEEWRDELGETS